MEVSVLLYFLLISLFCDFAVAEERVPNREHREIAMAEDSILTSLMVHRNPVSKYLCTENSYACLGADKAELGLSLIAARNTNASLVSLSRLARFKMDAGLSEDFTCAILEKGKKVEKIIRRIVPNELESRCKKEVSQVKGKNPGRFEVSADAICTPAAEIKERLRELRAGIMRGQRCLPEDY
jgi:hypothetical protein